MENKKTIFIWVVIVVVVGVATYLLIGGESPIPLPPALPE